MKQIKKPLRILHKNISVYIQNVIFSSTNACVRGTLWFLFKK